MGKIFLEEMEFHAYHGCLPEEKKHGNRFVVDVEIDTDMEAASRNDSLNNALDYAKVYDTVKQEMEIRSDLLEHVSGRILERIFAAFPQTCRAEVKVSKLNPPCMGKMKKVTVSQQKIR
ncbi:MAG: dihydroneopterin aldolase [Bacteroidales bacterium]|nr:dihydroneopterin aldolase [Bacteroidales bacterium]